MDESVQARWRCTQGLVWRHVGTELVVYDADRCPYCARARIALAEKGVEHELFALIFRRNGFRHGSFP